MSTNDVPGHDPKNRDELSMGCWAEHEDGSLILVESTEDDRVIYSVFDVATTPITEYRDSMRVGAFKKQFSWDPKKKESIKWTWHDKTPFPWDKVIKRGAKDGPRHADVEEQLTAAERIRRSREIHHGRELDVERDVRIPKLVGKAKKILQKLQKAIEGLEK